MRGGAPPCDERLLTTRRNAALATILLAHARIRAVSVFDHVSLGVRDLDRAVVLYDACLAPLGLVRLWRVARAAGYGPPGFVGEAPFALVLAGADACPPGQGTHFAFAASSRGAVDRFHEAALREGALDEGPPGIREHYDAGYYAAFVRDLDGHRLEAVFHEPLE
jgi:catechol 2,3-dioxygenase-like lactoylglutathione lyase family enzyme